MIPFCEPDISPYVDAVTDCIAHGLIGPGEKCKELEQRLSERYGMTCVLTCSGSVALSIVGRLACPEGIVCVPGYGVHSVPNAFDVIGISMRAIDVDHNGCMDSNALLPMLETEHFGIRAVCFVDFAGRHANSTIRDICDHYELFMIEDAACAISLTQFIGDAAIVSFSVPKMVTAGQGGAMLFKSEDMAQEARWLVDQGKGTRQDGYALTPGSNLRMTDMQAALILAQLDDLSQIIERRREIHKAMGSLPLADPPLFNIVWGDDARLERLRRYNIDARRQYKMLGNHPAYEHVWSKDLPMSKMWEEQAIFLPFGSALTLDQAQHISHVLGSDV